LDLWWRGGRWERAGAEASSASSPTFTLHPHLHLPVNRSQPPPAHPLHLTSCCAAGMHRCRALLPAMPTRMHSSQSRSSTPWQATATPLHHNHHRSSSSSSKCSSSRCSSSYNRSTSSCSWTWRRRSGRRKQGGGSWLPGVGAGRRGERSVASSRRSSSSSSRRKSRSCSTHRERGEGGAVAGLGASWSSAAFLREVHFREVPLTRLRVINIAKVWRRAALCKQTLVLQLGTKTQTRKPPYGGGGCLAAVTLACRRTAPPCVSMGGRVRRATGRVARCTQQVVRLVAGSQASGGQAPSPGSSAKERATRRMQRTTPRLARAHAPVVCLASGHLLEALVHLGWRARRVGCVPRSAVCICHLSDQGLMRCG